jgi:lysophospholipase L1-like esterase
VRKKAGALLLVGVLAACGGRSPAAPSGSGSPPPPPVTLGAVATVRGLVFYDENGNGSLDPDEAVRLPGAMVKLGGRSGSTDAAGHFEIAEVPAGAPRAEVVLQSLPPYFVLGLSPNVPVPPPDGFELALSVNLPVGSNHRNVYMAFGDSITIGDGSSGRRGYRVALQSDLAAWFGRAQVLNEGVEGTDSERGLDRLGDLLARRQPAFTLIHYGTNDWNGFGCRTVCGTTENLRRMVRICRAASSLPVVATLIPANPAYESLLASARNDWIVATNVQIRAMAAAEGATLADLHAAFVREDPELEPLFSDHVHPNDRGYAVMAAEFFRALSAPRSP